MKLLPYLPTTKPIIGHDAARRFDAGVFELHAALDAFARLPVEGEFGDRPAMHANLATAPMPPFIHAVIVSRGSGMFPHSRAVVQVRTVGGFDELLGGTLRGGFLSNGDRPAEPPRSKGALSLSLYARPTE